MLPHPVESTVVERQSSKGFRVAVAEMNGWRNSMEDSHLIYMKEEWAFFGVFDGHGGEKCSAFVSNRIREELDKKGCPKDDEVVKELILGVDQDFLDTQQPSGSTATMCIVHLPTGGGKHKLRVINAGDSRVLLGRRDGTIVDGGGTDQGLTNDHKPNEPAEQERIYRCGGFVEVRSGNCARVNGDLAVSRGFGDAEYKKTGGPGPEDRPVTANPEMGTFECDADDFLLLVCDGVSEGDFPNPEVVKFVAQCLKENDDLGAAAKAVCHKSVEMNSKDNVTCMIVTFIDPKQPEHSTEFIPGAITGCRKNKSFLAAYTAMAQKADHTLARAGELRYEIVEDMLAKCEAAGEQIPDSFRDELEAFDKPAGSKGDQERRSWFEVWAKKIEEKPDEDGGPNSEEVLSRLMSMPGGQQTIMDLLRSQAVDVENGRRVRVPDIVTLKKVVSEHPELKWDPKMEVLGDAEGMVEADDPSDGTSSIRFPAPISLKAWLPTAALIDLDDP